MSQRCQNPPTNGVGRNLRSHACGLGPVNRTLLLTITPVNPPTATVGDAADLLDVEVDHVAGPAGGDLARLAVGITVGVEEPSMVQSEVSKVSCDATAVEPDALIGQLVSDPPRGPLILAPPRLDLGNYRRRGRGGAVVGCRGSVEQTELTVPPPSVHPLARAGAGDAHLSRDVGDGSGAASFDEPTAPFDGQRCVLVRHWAAPGAEVRRAVSRLSMAW